MLLAHANGFCKEVWRAVEEELLACAGPEALLHIVAVDLPGHGAGPPLTLAPNTQQGLAASKPDWDSLGDCVLRAVAAQQRHHRRQQPLLVVGVGHSLGGAACMLAARELFERGVPSTTREQIEAIAGARDESEE